MNIADTRIWGAASRPHLPFDKDFTHNYIDLLECVCLKIDVQNIIHTMGNPFKVINTKIYVCTVVSAANN